MGIKNTIKKMFGIVEIIRLRFHKKRHAEGMPLVSADTQLHLIFGDKGIGKISELEIIEIFGLPGDGRSNLFNNITRAGKETLKKIEQTAEEERWSVKYTDTDSTSETKEET